MEIGLVGKTNTGKSTFFKASTLIDVEISNRVFTTIKPHTGIAYYKTRCPCKELGVTCNPQNSKCVNGARLVPVKLWDIAGLVPGAHEGKGLGLQFLDDIRQASVLIHVLDISGKTDENGEPTEDYDSSKDVAFLEKEIDFWFLDIFKKEWKSFSGKLRSGKGDFVKEFARRFSGLGVREEDIEVALEETSLSEDVLKWSEEDMLRFVTILRKRTKPMVIAANKIDVPGSEEKLNSLRKAYPDYKIIPTSAESELALREADAHDLIRYVPGESNFDVVDNSKLSEKQRQALDFIRRFLEKWKTTGVQECINAAVDAINYIVVYPVEDENKLCNKDGHVLPDAYLVPKGTTAKELAFLVHEDIGKHYIYAVDCRTHQRIAADHELKDGDIIHIQAAK